MKEIKQSIETNISLFQKNLQKVNSFADLCRLYDLPNNGKQHKYFKELISKNDFSISNWDWHEKLKKHKNIEGACPVCGNIFITKDGGRGKTTYCSRKCSNSIDSKHSEESKEKISESIKKYLLSIGKIPRTRVINKDGKRVIVPALKIKCVICGKEKKVYRKTQKCCSNKCAAQYKNKNPAYIQKLKDAAQKVILEGRHKPWTSRKIVSYPEKFFMTVLKNNNIEYHHNLLQGKYFIDFAIEEGNKKIALEIDGKQHKYPDRILKDAERDKFLTDGGWLVYRIPWKSINTEEGKLYMKEQIDKFLEVYKNLITSIS